ncbi:MAG: hypothetical protein MUF81_14955, partial [Verrucomicrobia bacterium]|nr:hypothetical protein [Verrucomicrobiota bacterium]
MHAKLKRIWHKLPQDTITPEIEQRIVEAVRNSRTRETASLSKLRKGLWQRDTTPEEEAAILRATRKARAEMRKEHFKPRLPPTVARLAGTVKGRGVTATNKTVARALRRK